MVRPPRPSILVCLLALAAATPAGAASTARVALIGDAAPGGGVFAGPGFTGWPSAGGGGWVAFRGEVSGGATSEALLAARMIPPFTRVQVASIGQTSPGGDPPFERCAGIFRQFLGQPVVNAEGEVAFLALLNPPRGQGDAEEEPPTPIRAGIFLFRGGTLRPVACSGQEIAAGMLDLAASLDPADATGDVAERAPALNDRGDVAFLTGLLDAQHAPAGGAIVLAALNQSPRAALLAGDQFEDGEVLTLGPPAINRARELAFHALVSTSDATDDDGVIDGIFVLRGNTLALVARDGLVPTGFGDALEELLDPVSFNDDGDVAFLAGPLVDPAADPDDGLVEEPGLGVLLARGGEVSVIAYPGLGIDADRVTGLALGPSAGGALAPPTVNAEGHVVFFAALNGGGAEAIVRSDAVTGELSVLVHTLGPAADDTPAGGIYNGLRSAPAFDEDGGVAFLARVAGGSTSEALVYLPASGQGSPILVGDAAPLSGFLAGRPFSSPILTDRGEVVFRSYVARGPASVGIFRWTEGRLDAVVRAGDDSPNPGHPPFLDIVGDPSVNADGAVAFAAIVRDEGRGIYVADGQTIRLVARRGDPAPGPAGTTFASIAGNPAINNHGQVAFRATTQLRDEESGITTRRRALLLADGNVMTPLVWEGTPSPEGRPFFRLRDPVLSDAPALVFRAPLGELAAVRNGVFEVGTDRAAPIALERQDLGGDVLLTSLSGDPVVAPGGGLAFLAARARILDPAGPTLESLGPTIFRGSAAGIVPLVGRGDRAILGGVFRSLGQPSINDAGHIAFRATFQAGTGGTGGIYLAGERGIVPAVLARDIGVAGARFTSFGAQPSVNASDDIAFSAGLSQGDARTGLFLAAPADLVVPALRIRLGGTVVRPRDRVGVRLRLFPGRLADGIDAGHEPVLVALHDTEGPLWSAAVPARRLGRRAGWFVARIGNQGALRRTLRGLRLRVRRSGVVTLSARSAVVDFTRNGVRELHPPFTLLLQVGNDSAAATLDCPLDPGGARCSG